MPPLPKGFVEMHRMAIDSAEAALLNTLQAAVVQAKAAYEKKVNELGEKYAALHATDTDCYVVFEGGFCVIYEPSRLVTA